MREASIILIVLSFLLACGSDDPDAGIFELKSAFVGSLEMDLSGSVTDNVPVDRAIVLTFSLPLDENSLETGVILSTNDQPVNRIVTLSSQNNMLSLSVIGTLTGDAIYTISLTDQLRSADGAGMEPVSFRFRTRADELEIISVTVDGQDASDAVRVQNIDTGLAMTFDFSTSVDMASFAQAFSLPGIATDIVSSNDDKTVHVTSTTALAYLKKYVVTVTDELLSQAGGSFDGFSFEFYTQLDSTFKFPEISDDALLTKVQEQTFKYFWDFAHPNSGLTRERNTSGNLVTIGGSGFGVMAILVGMERGFITREEGVDRLETITNFLSTADRFHGAWPHWMNGITGETIPFSANDDGADLVETAFMVQGLLTAKQYLDNGVPKEAGIINTIDQLWQEVEWDWFTQGGQDVLYWHWSPNFGWQKNLRVSGWNESLIVYVLAAASSAHSISADVYHKGWAREGGMINGNTFYNRTLPLGEDLGGPLFFSHYSFLGLDPRNLKDQYADYWEQNVSHSLINQAYAMDNPLGFVGYSAACWGLTASDNDQGYSAHSPANDRGVITPTAALSSMPYSPNESIAALKHFYYLLGDRLWGEYGFFDAFNLTAEWTADSYLAIDQGPIIIMIENYRTALLWDLFMSNADITGGLEKLGFETN